ncbi:MAG: glycosyltransferase family 4 protein [Actinomycetota bacterium]|nr:glycosyltransferase family 4 protein [Actinomycetota bacterium]
MKKGKLAFVTPRYGPGVVGGSEAVSREAAHGFAARGYEVDVLTTCAMDHYTWANQFDPGVARDGDVTVRRFPTVAGRDLARWVELQERLLAGKTLDEAEELSWVNGRFRVPELYLHLSASARDYDAIVFSPYLFWSTLYCVGIAPERTVLMPCLHDEAYARLRLVRAALSGAAALWFLSEPEHQLGHRLAALPPHHFLVGAAVEVPERYDTTGFRERFGIERPYVLYAGRREDGKGWRQVLGAFGAAVLRHRVPFDLVTIGVGDPDVPAALEQRVTDLGYLDPAEVPNAFAGAVAYLQPSANESFSRTIMEAWLGGTLVIASSASDVVTWHCERSGSGLLYGDELELGECLRFVAEAPKLAEELARGGREYVLANYTWPHVLDAMERSLEVLR